MRILKIVMTILILGGLMVPLLSCASDEDAQSPESQLVTVQRGNLTIDITASGNLALSRTEDLAFEVAGTVEDILVEEGDTVEEGQVLARLDTTEWDNQVKTLERNLTTAQRKLTAAERSVVTDERQVTDLKRQVTVKENAVIAAERQVTAKELVVKQEQVDLQTAEYNLSKIDEVKELQDTIDDAEYTVKFAKSMLAGEFGAGAQLTDYAYWSQLAANANEQLTEAQGELEDILNGLSIAVSSDVALLVAQRQLQVEQSQMALEDAQIDVEDARQDVVDARIDVEDARQDVVDARIDVEDARQDVVDAQQDLEDAQEALDEAKSKSPEITAPFAGFITRVNVEGGDEVLKGTVAVQLADPNKFEADILVSEMDILNVKLEGEAWVQVDAMQGMSLPAKVTHISPTATIQSGVVNYQVKVEVGSLEAVMQERQAARQTMQQIMAGEVPEQLRQAIEEGRVTLEEVQERMNRRDRATTVPRTDSDNDI